MNMTCTIESRRLIVWKKKNFSPEHFPDILSKKFQNAFSKKQSHLQKSILYQKYLSNGEKIIIGSCIKNDEDSCLDHLTAN